MAKRRKGNPKYRKVTITRASSKRGGKRVKTTVYKLKKKK